MEKDKPTAARTFPESPVPGALGRVLALLERRVGLESIDRVWVFPPLVKGRKEWGLVAVSCWTESGEQRTLVTGKYTAELTGKGVEFEPEFFSEGLVPPDRLGPVMDGVARRSDLQLGVAMETEIGGDPERFRGLLIDLGWGEQDEDLTAP